MSRTDRTDLVTVGSLLIEMTPSRPGEAFSAAHQYTCMPGGAAANMVCALGRLGVGVRFITAVGDDEFGAFLVQELTAFGVDTSGVRRIPGQLTPITFCAIDGHGGKTFNFYRFPGYCSPMQSLERSDFDGTGHGRLFDFSEGSIRELPLREMVFQAARDARASGAVVLYAVNFRRDVWRMTDDAIRAVQYEAIGLADIVVLNGDELEYLTGRTVEDGVRVIQQYGPRVVVVTRGKDGPMLVRVGDEIAGIMPYRVPVVFDVGAGDTFHAGLVAAALQEELSSMSIAAWVEAARFGAAVAAMRISTSADLYELPTRPQVAAWMKQATTM